MNAKKFDEILQETLKSTEAVLASKANEYAKGDRFYNFKRAAGILGSTPEQALVGMLIKHLVSVLDLVEGTLPLSRDLISEKLGDSINYLILLKALLLEKLSLEVEGETDTFYGLAMGHSSGPEQSQTIAKPIRMPHIQADATGRWVPEYAKTKKAYLAQRKIGEPLFNEPMPVEPDEE